MCQKQNKTNLNSSLYVILNDFAHTQILYLILKYL